MDEKWANTADAFFIIVRFSPLVIFFAIPAIIIYARTELLRFFKLFFSSSSDDDLLLGGGRAFTQFDNSSTLSVQTSGAECWLEVRVLQPHVTLFHSCLLGIFVCAIWRCSCLPTSTSHSTRFSIFQPLNSRCNESFLVKIEIEKKRGKHFGTKWCNL